MQKIGQFDYEPILGGDFQKVTTPVTLKAGQIYKVGSVLGIDGTGLCSLVDSSKSDGTESVYAVLAETVDATYVNMAAAAWMTGEFERERLIFGGTDTWQAHEAAAREVSIFFKDAALQPNGEDRRF